MIEALRAILELSRVDEERRDVEHEDGALPGRRAVLVAEREALETGLAEAREGLGAAEHAQRQLEAALADTEADLARLESQQSQVASNEAYRTLLHEMEVAREKISAHETSILEAMDQVEAAQGALSRAEEAGRLGEARIREQEGALDARAEQLAKDRVRLEETRAAQCARLSDDLVKRYEKIASHRHPAAVLVSGEICPGCQVGIPPQLLLDLISAEDPVHCDSCRRFLIHQRLVEG
ncbi:MAG: hypothetical protein QNK03_19290 [Myxococcota bacterium]|nr:hypothetical protein [Myxococcota bacterium]